MIFIDRETKDFFPVFPFLWGLFLKGLRGLVVSQLFSLALSPLTLLFESSKLQCLEVKKP